MNEHKHFLVICILNLLIPLHVFSQAISMSGDIGSKPIMPPLTMLDTAQIKVFYELKYKKDSTKAAMTEAQTILLCGSRYLMFADYYDLLNDSLYMDAEKRHLSGMAIMGSSFSLMNNIKYPTLVIANLSDGRTIVREKSGVNYYQYEDTVPKLRWQLDDADSVILGYHCGRASCRYKGRDYEAWYSKDISLPLGPYLFGGLPGIIMKICDTRGNYVFTLNGLEPNPKTLNQIYITSPQFLVKGTREKIRETILKSKQYPVEQMLNAPALRIPDETATRLDRKADAYNPLELE